MFNFICSRGFRSQVHRHFSWGNEWEKEIPKSQYTKKSMFCQTNWKYISRHSNNAYWTQIDLESLVWFSTFMSNHHSHQIFNLCWNPVPGSIIWNGFELVWKARNDNNYLQSIIIYFECSGLCPIYIWEWCSFMALKTD